MELPKEKRKALRITPKTLIIFGASKAGKTTKLTELPDCLIIDLENGADMLEGMIVTPSNLEEYGVLLRNLEKEPNRYKYIALDTLDVLYEWIEKKVISDTNKEIKIYNEENPNQKRPLIKTIGDIPYGAGYDEVRQIMRKNIVFLKNLANSLILVGHRKRIIIGSDKVELTADSLELPGKLKNMIMADADAVGYVFRDNFNNDELRISFKAKDSLEAGTRCQYLAGKEISFDWNKIFTPAEIINDR